MTREKQDLIDDLARKMAVNDLMYNYRIRAITEFAEKLENLFAIPIVMPSVYGIFKHGIDKVYGYYWSLETAEEICNEMNGDDYYIDELCVDEH